jgi:hypothetical protein
LGKDFLRPGDALLGRDCTEAQRLDVHNGLLLSALWDAAFDKGLVSFADERRGSGQCAYHRGRAAGHAN